MGIVVEFVLFDVLRVISDASGAAVNPKDAADFDALAPLQSLSGQHLDALLDFCFFLSSGIAYHLWSSGPNFGLDAVGSHHRHNQSSFPFLQSEG